MVCPRALVAVVELAPLFPLAVERLEHPVPKSTRIASPVREAEMTKLRFERQLELRESACFYAALANCNQFLPLVPIDNLEREDCIFT